MDQLVKPASANLAARLMASSDNDQRVREAFLTIYGRSPDREELRACAGYLTARSPEAGVSQLLWALLTSAEFQLNH